MFLFKKRLTFDPFSGTIFLYDTFPFLQKRRILMKPNMTPQKPERASDRSVAFFSIAIAFLAIFACVLVTVLMLPRKNTASKPEFTTDPPPSNTPTEEPIPEDTTPVFSPSVNVLPYTSENTQTSPAEIASQLGILVDAESGEILVSKGGDQRMEPASMTKIMTLLVACQRLTVSDLGKNVTYTQEIHNYVRPASGGYKGTECHWADVGDGATVLDQLYGIGVKSAADCTVMIACYIVGKSPAESEAQFVQWMNEEATAMGLTGTHFDNIVGYESEQNYSTPSDIAAILIRALESPMIADILGTTTYAFKAYGYSKDGTFNPSYPSYFHSTMFNALPNDSTYSSRMKSYEAQYGKFSLKNLTLKGGKTGSLENGNGWNFSLASFATSSDGKTYVCITVDANMSAAVLKDAKTLYDSIVS